MSLLARIRRRLPVVPRRTRDEVVAEHTRLMEEHADLQRRYDELGGNDLVLRERIAHYTDPSVAPFLIFAPPGHFYSPIPPLDEAVERARRVFADPPATLPGIDLRLEAQLALAEELAPLQADFDPPDQPVPGRRYHTDNPSYGPADARVLQALLRHLRPDRVIEIGSGHSTALMLDVADEHLDGLELTCIEPFDAVLRSVLRPEDAGRVEIVAAPVQEVDLDRFDRLAAGDLLFIDSTHVVRAGSDVAREVFEILPRLRPGVVVHFHDLFYPFDYPAPWVAEGRAWSEAYLLRAFLEHNDRFEILLFPHYLRTVAPDRLRALWPHAPTGGGSLWLRRVR